jgi:hypothetical protein
MLEFESWTLNWGADLHPYNARSGGGNQQVEAGNNGGSGTITGFMDTSDPLTSQVVTGSTVAVSLQHTSTGPVAWTGNIKIGKYNTGGNRDGTVQPVSFEFMTHGATTAP